jgi:hypothetical protein
MISWFGTFSDRYVYGYALLILMMNLLESLVLASSGGKIWEIK